MTERDLRECFLSQMSDDKQNDSVSNLRQITFLQISDNDSETSAATLIAADRKGWVSRDTEKLK